MPEDDLDEDFNRCDFAVLGIDGSDFEHFTAIWI